MQLILTSQVICNSFENIANLEEIVNAYNLRTVDEDLQRISQIGGIEAIAKKLDTDLANGLAEDDFTRRQQLFGINKLTNSRNQKKNFVKELFSKRFYSLLIILDVSLLLVSVMFARENLLANLVN